MKTIAVFLLLVIVACTSQAKPRGSGVKGAPVGGRLEHEITNRVIHADRTRRHEHPPPHHPPPGSNKHQHNNNNNNNNRPAQHAVHKKILQQQQEDELLQSEDLLHVRPRTPQAAPHRDDTGTSSGKHAVGGISKKAQKFAQVVAAAKANAAAKARFYAKVGAGKGGKLGPMTKEYKEDPLAKEYKGHRGAKKYNSKKHAWKKTGHKEKLLRNRQLKRELKERSLQQQRNKKDPFSKDFSKAKEILRKEKAIKKKERREKRAKVMAYRKKE